MELARKIADPLLPVIGMQSASGADYRYDLLRAELASAYRDLAGH
jgi:hypothetical protein